MKCSIRHIHHIHTSKVYKLYNLLTKTIFTSKDVRFHENIFPFHHSNFLTSLLKPDTSFPHGSSLFPVSTHDLSLDSSISNFDMNSVPTTGFSLLISSFHSPNLPEIYTQESTPTPPVPTRQSIKSKRAHSYLEDYHCSLASQVPVPQSKSMTRGSMASNQYPISEYLDYGKLSPAQRKCSLALSTIYEP